MVARIVAVVKSGDSLLWFFVGHMIVTIVYVLVRLEALIASEATSADCYWSRLLKKPVNILALRFV